MSSIPNVLTNKFVLTGIGKSAFKETTLVKPIFGAAGRMGTVASEYVPTLLSTRPELRFRADLNATRSRVPSGLGKPNFITKTPNKYR